MTAAGGKRGANSFPENRGDGEADHHIENGAGLLCVDFVHVDASRCGDGGSDCAWSDFVEDDAREGGRIFFEKEGDGIGDGFSFAIIVGGQINRLDSSGGLLEGGERFGFFLEKGVAWFEIAVETYCAEILFQRTDMSHRGDDGESWAEVGGDFLTFRWRFHDNQGFHSGLSIVLVMEIEARDGAILLAPWRLLERRLLENGSLRIPCDR